MSLRTDPASKSMATGEDELEAPPPDLAEALRGVEQFLRQYVAFARPETVVAVVLWVVVRRVFQPLSRFQSM